MKKTLITTHFHAGALLVTKKCIGTELVKKTLITTHFHAGTLPVIRTFTSAQSVCQNNKTKVGTMIYTIICDAYGREISVNKRDCQLTRQPLPHFENNTQQPASQHQAKAKHNLPCFSENIQKYIDETKNEKLKNERFCAYVVLFSALKAFFDLDSQTIERASDGKPYFPENEKIFFNISHSEGVVAVTISDEGEVGVDLQQEPDSSRQERLEKRFVSGLKIHTNDPKICYLLCQISNDGTEFSGIEPCDCVRDDFLAKWVYAESLIKLSGGGFKDISLVDRIAENTIIELKEFSVENKKYALSTAKKC